MIVATTRGISDRQYILLSMSPSFNDSRVISVNCFAFSLINTVIVISIIHRAFCHFVINSKTNRLVFFTLSHIVIVRQLTL